MTEKKVDRHLRRRVIEAEANASLLEYIADVVETNRDVSTYFGGWRSALHVAEVLRNQAEAIRHTGTMICTCYPQASWELKITPHASIKDWETYLQERKELEAQDGAGAS